MFVLCTSSDLKTDICVALRMCEVIQKASNCRQDRVRFVLEIPFLRDIQEIIKKKEMCMFLHA